jgi:hypothetical protein
MTWSPRCFLGPVCSADHIKVMELPMLASSPDFTPLTFSTLNVIVPLRTKLFSIPTHSFSDVFSFARQPGHVRGLDGKAPWT